jgi:hypothetical protein
MPSALAPRLPPLSMFHPPAPQLPTSGSASPTLLPCAVCLSPGRLVCPLATPSFTLTLLLARFLSTAPPLDGPLPACLAAQPWPAPCPALLLCWLPPCCPACLPWPLCCCCGWLVAAVVL